MRKQQKQSMVNDSIINLVDVGSRWGLDTQWRQFKQNELKVYAVEADKQESKILRQKYPQWEIINSAVGNKIGLSVLHMTKEPGKSSLRIPNTEIVNRFDNSHEYDIRRKQKIKIVTLDSYFRKDINKIDCVKIDAQGMSFEIIQGMKQVLKNTVFLQVEVEFLSIYKNQKLFHSVNEILFKWGFELLDLQRHWYKNKRKGRGQIIFADAYFVKNNKELSKLEDSKINKLIKVLEVMDYNGKASEIRKEFNKLIGEYNLEINQKPGSKFMVRVKSFLLRINISIIHRMAHWQFNLINDNWGNDGNSVDFTKFRRFP